jgi:hypothetical protein
MFLWSQTRLLRAETKTMHPYECGNPKCKAIALGWLSNERFPRDHRHQPVASLANRRARRDRVRHPPPILNSTNSNASCPATLHRKGGCPVHQLARSWLQYWLTLASSTVISKSKQPRAKLWSLDCRKWTWANFNSQPFLWHSCKNHTNHKLLIFTPL